MVTYIEGDISTMPDVSVAMVQSITDSTVTSELANGNVYILRNAWCAGDGKIDTGERKTKVKFEGLSCEEDLAA